MVPLQHREQVYPFDILKSDKVFVANPTHIQDLHNVGVRQLTDDLRLVVEHLDKGGVVAEIAEHPLDRYGLFETAKAWKRRAKHLGHATTTDPLAQDITAEVLG